MTVRRNGTTVHLEGRCHVEDAEPLLRHLLELEVALVDLSSAEHLHTAVLQVLMASRPKIVGGDPSSFACRWLIGAGYSG